MICGFSGAMLDWKCPNRARGSDIPLDVYQEIFVWLRPAADPDTDIDFYNTTLACLALVCRYFAHYATYEMWRCLELDGGNYRKFRMPEEAWCTGVEPRLQPVQTLRTHVRKCTLRNWVGRPNFTTQVIPMLSHLDNLAALTLHYVPMTRALLQSIGRLRTLETLTVFRIIADEGTFREAQTHHPVFELQDTPFPALRRLAVRYIDYTTDRVLQDALHILASAPSLRTIVFEDSRWLHQLLPLINPQLVSLCGDLTSITPAAFLRFIKVHAALQNLTVYFSDVEAQCSYLGIDLDPADLPDLRSFSGPFALAPKVISSRPLTKLASPCFMLFDSEPVTYLPWARDEWMVLDIHLVHDVPEVWRALKPIGGGISQLFVCISNRDDAVLSQISLCFPNLVHLHIELPNDYKSDLSGVLSRNTLLHLKSLKSLAIYGIPEDNGVAYLISPGEQHHFVHDMYQACCPTLEKVVFGLLMVWHLRAFPTKAGECHCELELLSPRTIRRRLQSQNLEQLVYDWQGRLARLLREAPPGLSEVEIGRIIEPEY
ncbi:hypothetical protein JB92DRAFT_2884120 [Gautieria morchelliformis]|nr:hypothetical protein JB92DRAFT_2884120 [Gautieria morchelliformis]